MMQSYDFKDKPVEVYLKDNTRMLGIFQGDFGEGITILSPVRDSIRERIWIQKDRISEIKERKQETIDKNYRELIGEGVIVSKKEEKITNRVNIGILIDVNDEFVTLEFEEGKFGFIPLTKVEKVGKFGNRRQEKEETPLIIPAMPRTAMYRRIKELGIFEGIVHYKNRSWERRGRIWASDRGFSAYVFDEKTDTERKIDLRHVSKIEVLKISKSTNGQPSEGLSSERER